MVVKSNQTLTHSQRGDILQKLELYDHFFQDYDIAVVHNALLVVISSMRADDMATTQQDVDRMMQSLVITEPKAPQPDTNPQPDSKKPSAKMEI